VDFQPLWANEPAYSSPDHPWLQVLQRDSQEILGEELRFRFSHGFTDARFFHLRGIPAAAIGRRGFGGAPDEYIEVEDLCKSAELFAVATYDYLTMQG
jgi:acetylornithine deacetylase/succinyl-diaminopimelate desuccinylase-like protein